MWQHGAVKTLQQRRASTGVYLWSGALLGIAALYANLSAASAKPQPDTPQGTIWMQVLNSGIAKEASKGTEGIPGKSIASSFARYTPQKGLQLRGLACYGITCDPIKNEICFMRGRSAAGESEGQNVFYLASVSGSNVRLLKRQGVDYTSARVEDYSPRFMPNGDILFEEGGRIAIMNRSGANLRYVTKAGEDCGTPSVSQDGKKIAFESNGLWVTDVAGKHRLKLLTFDTFYGSTPGDGADPAPYSDVALSPDGKQVAYARITGKTAQIYVLPTASPASKTNPSYQVSGLDKRFKISQYANPVWSPDGKFLAVAGGSKVSHDVYLIEVATGKMRRLIATSEDEYPNAWVSSKS